MTAKPDVAIAPLNSHARYAQRTAGKLGWSWRSLDGNDAFLFEVSDGQRRAVLGAGSVCPYALNPASAYTVARDKAFANAALERAGLPIIESRLFFVTDRHAAFRSPGRELSDALAFAKRVEFPLFCKPNSGARGDMAELISDKDAFADYLQRASARYDAILVQPFVGGREYRVCVLQGEAIFSYAKVAPRLIADGESTIAELYERRVTRLRQEHTRVAGARYVSADGESLASDAVPAAGARISIVGPANRASGGGAEEFAAPAPAPLAKFALACTRALGLSFAGVDVFDVSPKRNLGAFMVIEVNASPAFETLEELGRWDLIERVWTANLKAALG